MNKIFRLARYDLPLHFILVLTNWLPDNVIFIRLRGFLSRPFFKHAGRRLGIGRYVTFYNPSQIEIGDDVYFAMGCWISGSYGIKIESEVLFGPYVIIAPSNHTLFHGSYRFGAPDGSAVIIGKGSWLGAHVTILKGVIIGEGVLVAANSVVNNKIESFSIVGGVPAKDLKKLI